jgi:hypothetical protein
LLSCLRVPSPSSRAFARTVAVSVISIVFTTSVVAARAQSPAQVRGILQSSYAKMDAAYAKKDVAKVLSYRTPTYLSITEEGTKVPAAENKKRLEALFSTIADQVRTVTKIDSLTVKGNEAIAKVKQHAEITIVKATLPPQRSKMVMDVNSEDIWTRTPKGWLLKQSKNVSGSQSLDGKPFKFAKKKPAQSR